MGAQTKTDLASIGVLWGEPDPEAMEAIRQSRVSTVLLRKLQREMQETVRERIREVLLESVQLGLHPRDAATRLREEVGTILQATQARLNNIARTEQLDSYREAARQAQLANTDVVVGWIWMSVLSTTSCPSCISMHGSVHDVEESGPDDHPQGRCYRMPKTKSWAEMGFDITEPPSLIPDNQTWFNSLSEEQQRETLGPSRYEAWKEGRYPMDTWSKVVDNPDWRRSYQVSRPGEVVSAR